MIVWLFSYLSLSIFGTVFSPDSSLGKIGHEWAYPLDSRFPLGKPGVRFVRLAVPKLADVVGISNCTSARFEAQNSYGRVADWR